MLAVYQIGHKKYLLLDQFHPLHRAAKQAKTFTCDEDIKKWMFEQNQNSKMAPWIQLGKTHIIRFANDNQCAQLRSIENALDQMRPSHTHGYFSYEDVINYKYTYLYPSWHHFLSTACMLSLVAFAPILHQYLGAQFLWSFIFCIFALSALNFYGKPVSMSIEKIDITPRPVSQLLKPEDAASFHCTQAPQSTHSQSPLDASRPGHSL